MSTGTSLIVLTLTAAFQWVPGSCAQGPTRRDDGSPERATRISGDAAGIAYRAVIIGALSQEKWFAGRPAEVIQAYHVAQRLCDKLPAEDAVRCRTLLGERLQSAKTWMAEHSEPGELRKIPADELGFAQSPLATYQAYDALLRAALYAHFVREDRSAASRLYAAAENVIEMMPAGATRRGLLPELCRRSEAFYQDALAPSMSRAWHAEHLRELIGLAEGGARSSMPTSSADVPAIGLADSRAKRAPARLTFRSETDPGFVVAERALLEQALLADYWCDQAVAAGRLYSLAEGLARMRSDLDGGRELTYLQRRPGRGPAASEPVAGAEVHFRFWMEPGYVAVYCRLIENALYAEYCERDPRTALGLFRAARQLADGFDGSTALFEADRLDDELQRLESADRAKP